MSSINSPFKWQSANLRCLNIPPLAVCVSSNSLQANMNAGRLSFTSWANASSFSASVFFSQASLAAFFFSPCFLTRNFWNSALSSHVWIAAVPWVFDASTAARIARLASTLPGAWFLDLLPELFPCAGKSLRKMCILLKCYHLFLFLLSHKNFYCHTDITDITDFFIKNLRIREFFCNDKNFCFAMNLRIVSRRRFFCHTEIHRNHGNFRPPDSLPFVFKLCLSVILSLLMFLCSCVPSVASVSFVAERFCQKKNMFICYSVFILCSYVLLSKK